MLKTIYLGKLSDIRLYIHWTFWILVIFLGLRDLDQGWEAALRSIGFVMLVFLCVFLHELGHAFAGRIYNVRTLDITLYPIGGVARMEMKNLSPAAELVITACGPLVNLVIAVVLAATMALRISWEGVGDIGEMGILEQLLVVNVALFVFNLLPVYPMDGGRILRAILSFFVKRESAVEWTARLGQVLAALIAIYGLVTFQLTLVIIFSIMFFACSAELFTARVRRAMFPNGSPFPGFPNETAGDGSFDRNSQTSYGDQGPSASHGDVIDAENVRRLP